MNYIFLNPYLGFGGLEIQMNKRAEDALKAGHKALVVTYPDSRAEEYCILNNIPYHHFRIGYKYFDIKAIIKLGKIFKNFQSDICVIGKTEHLNIAITARNLFSPKTAVVLYQQMQSGLKKKDWFHNRIYRNLDGAVTIAQYMKHLLSDNTIFPYEKITVIPYGLKTDSFNPANFNKSLQREKYQINHDEFVVGCVARIEPHKDQLLLIEAFAEAKIGKSSLVLVGNIDNNEYFKLLQDKVNELNLNKKVKFISFSENIQEIMNSFDGFVLPSRSETLGLVVMEAMAAGLPVIATRSGGVVELIDENETGLFFEPGDGIKP